MFLWRDQRSLLVKVVSLTVWLWQLVEYREAVNDNTTSYNSCSGMLKCPVDGHMTSCTDQVERIPPVHTGALPHRVPFPQTVCRLSFSLPLPLYSAGTEGLCCATGGHIHPSRGERWWEQKGRYYTSCGGIHCPKGLDLRRMQPSWPRGSVQSHHSPTGAGGEVVGHGHHYSR